MAQGRGPCRQRGAHKGERKILASVAQHEQQKKNSKPVQHRFCPEGKCFSHFFFFFFFYNGLNHSLGTSPWAVYSGLGREVPSRMYTGGVQRTSSCQRVVLGHVSALRRLYQLLPYFYNAIIFGLLGSSSSPVQSPWVFGNGRWRFFESTFASGSHLGSAARISAMAVL